MNDLPKGHKPLLMSRLCALIAAALTVAAGLGSRSVLPGDAGKVAGDVLYTVLVYTLVVLAAPRIRPAKAALVALGVSWAVEFFQATGIPAELSRRSVLARLVLGTTFNVPDLCWYVAGAAFGWLVHRAVGAAQRRRRHNGASGV
ncbi:MULTISPECIES: ribosomal maturation YjgA family protein [Kitasatospora]|uniref:DUF2809 domain-containing protein n=1 Tax=Kitasatospora cystarginea TaxID=58350 RepID=A0ABP5R9A3_9ACTN